ncbi:MAG: LCP family protein [Clostridiales bacterium]|nr:LCP family protein [Clostridiales bacterium]
MGKRLSRLIILLAALLLSISACSDKNDRSNKHNRSDKRRTAVSETEETETIETVTDPDGFDESVKNYLLVFSDSMLKNEQQNSTSYMVIVVSVDHDNKTIKFIPLDQNTYVNVPGYSDQMPIRNITLYGGYDLLVDTIENNMMIPVTGYIGMSFYDTIDIVDSSGGVVCNVSEKELQSEMASWIQSNDYSLITGYESVKDAIPSGGSALCLDGEQALTYLLIKEGLGECRSYRHVEILSSYFERYSSMDSDNRKKASDTLCGCVDTDIACESIASFLDKELSMYSIEKEYLVLPIEGCYESGMFDGGDWSIRPNWNSEIPYIHEYIYGKVYDHEVVKDISDSPDLKDCPTDLPIDSLICVSDPTGSVPVSGDYAYTVVLTWTGHKEYGMPLTPECSIYTDGDDQPAGDITIISSNADENGGTMVMGLPESDWDPYYLEVVSIDLDPETNELISTTNYPFDSASVTVYDKDGIIIRTIDVSEWLHLRSGTGVWYYKVCLFTGGVVSLFS